MAKEVLPIIDERIEYRGTSFLRTLTAEALAELKQVIVLQDGSAENRLAVLIPYDIYMKLQRLAVA